MRNRKIQIPIRVNEKEFKHLQKLTILSGLPRETVIRTLIMEQDIKARPPDEYIKVYRLVSNIANNTNQIAHIANATGYLHHEQITAMTMMIEKCWEHIKELR